MIVVVNANDFQVNQKKYLDLAKQNVKVFLKCGSDIFSIKPVPEQQQVNINSAWAEQIKKAEENIKKSKVTSVKNGDVWKMSSTV